ncbi:MAG TPA: hypothetical protein DER60_10260 [Syntrophomonas sp.]|jgi:hypothetical protein|nr:hypothetical protein [Syntrophomonas sp.]
MIADYKHEILNQDYKTISGHYAHTQEVRLPFHGREVLYIVGYGEIDTSCCGTGKFMYALVAGFIINWRGLNKDGLVVSRVELIRDETLQTELEEIIRQKEIVNQVNFL